jgi:Tfp pilus assembly protein PilV
MPNINKNKNQKGFTIVETLVAVTILMISIAGPLTVANKGLLAAINAKDQMIASYLAQDAMEYVKNT